MGMMKAVVYDVYGPPEVLSVREVPRPVPRAGEVLIRVQAAELNKGDCELRSFNFPVKWFWLPLRLGWGVWRPRRKILGGYFAGEVVESCPREGTSPRFAPGQAVLGCAQLKMGAHAEYIVLPESYPLVAKPEKLSFAEAASLPLGGLNALHFMNRANVTDGESVLIIGGGGSIGLAAIQIAKSRGASVTVVDKTSKEAVVREAGADVFLDYTRGETPDTSGRRHHVIFTMVPGSDLKRGLELLLPGGRYVMGNPQFAHMLRSAWGKPGEGKQVIFAFAPESSEALEALGALVEAGSLRPIVDSVLPMHEAAEAHRRVEAEERNGSIVLDFAST